MVAAIRKNAPGQGRKPADGEAPKVTTSISISRAILARLRKIAAERGVSVSQLLEDQARNINA